MASGLPQTDVLAVDNDTNTATTFGGYPKTGDYGMLGVGSPKDLNQPPNACCPPWNPAKLSEVMVYKYAKPSAGTFNYYYTLSFQPTNLFKREMQGYIEQLNVIDPTIYLIIIDWTIYDQGAGGVPMGWANGSSPGNNGSQITTYYFRTWKANGVSTNVEPINPTPAFFPGGPMQRGRWYMIHTGIYLNDNKKFFADSCANNDIYVRRRAAIGVPDYLEVYDATGKLLDKY
ncbi:MAG: hypothetical protein WA584_03290 [Pyrinomonadaceae bacterium]